MKVECIRLGKRKINKSSNKSIQLETVQIKCLKYNAKNINVEIMRQGKTLCTVTNCVG